MRESIKREIYELGCKRGERISAIDAIRKGIGYNEFENSLHNQKRDNFFKGFSESGFSIVDLIHRLVHPMDSSKRGKFEFEICDFERDHLGNAGHDVQGTPIAKEFLSFRDLTTSTTTTSAAGHTVADSIVPSEFTNYLYENTAVLKMSVKLEELRNNVVIIKLTGRAAADVVTGEDVAGTEQNQTFEKLTLKPKHIRTFTDISGTLLHQSTPSVENLIRVDLAKAVGIALDTVLLTGDGTSGAPTGLFNTTGIDTVTLPTDFISFDDLVELERVLRTNSVENSIGARFGWVLDEHALKSVRRMNQGYPVYENGQILGYPAEISTLIDDNTIVFANWDDSIVGMWGGIEILVDPNTLSTQDIIRLVVSQMADYGVKRIESFARLTTS